MGLGGEKKIRVVVPGDGCRRHGRISLGKVRNCRKRAKWQWKTSPGKSRASFLRNGSFRIAVAPDLHRSLASRHIQDRAVSCDGRSFSGHICIQCQDLLGPYMKRSLYPGHSRAIYAYNVGFRSFSGHVMSTFWAPVCSRSIDEHGDGSRLSLAIYGYSVGSRSFSGARLHCLLQVYRFNVVQLNTCFAKKLCIPVTSVAVFASTNSVEQFRRLEFIMCSLGSFVEGWRTHPSYFQVLRLSFSFKLQGVSHVNLFRGNVD